MHGVKRAAWGLVVSGAFALGAGAPAAGPAPASAPAATPAPAPAPAPSVAASEVRQIRGVSGERAVAEARAALTSGVRRLDLDGCAIKDDGLRALAAVPELAQVRTLILRNNQLGGDGLAALLAAAKLRELEELDLAFNEVAEAGVRALAKASLPRLVRLSLRSVLPGGPALKALAAAGEKALPQVRVLDLGENQIEDADLAPLLQSGWVRPLHELKLDQNQLTAVSITRLAALKLRELRRLDLSNNSVGAVGIRSLARAAFLPGLTGLALRYTKLGEEGVRELVKLLPSAARLTELELLGAGVSEGGLAAILATATARRLALLDLSYNALGDAGAARLAAIELPALTTLRLDECELGDAGARSLAQLRAKVLRSLSLGNNQLSEAGLGALLAATGMPGLAELSLRGNRISSLAPLVTLLPAQSPALRKLQLQGNPIAAPAGRPPKLRPELQLELP